MSIADTAIEEFGNTLGIPRLAFNDAGVVRLAFETTGSLSIERSGGGILLFLARPLERAREEALVRALSLCHFSHAERLRPNVGLTSDSELVFWVRIVEAAMDVAAIEEVLTLLAQLHDQIGTRG